jgi:hypothetical protein
MKPPPGLFPSPTSHVCKLRRSLYGLKQAPRAWFDKFRTPLLQFSFKQSKYDTSLFLWKSDMSIVLLLVYVDDIVITGSDSTLLDQLKTHLSESFHMKDLGSLTYFLGLEVHRGTPSIPSINISMPVTWWLQLVFKRLLLLILPWNYMSSFAKRRATYLLIPVYTGSWWVASFISPLLDRTFLLLSSQSASSFRLPVIYI